MLCGGLRLTFRSQFFPSTVGTRIKPQSSGLHSKHFYLLNHFISLHNMILLHVYKLLRKKVHWKGRITIVMLEVGSRVELYIYETWKAVASSAHVTLHGALRVIGVDRTLSCT